MTTVRILRKTKARLRAQAVLVAQLRERHAGSPGILLSQMAADIRRRIAAKAKP